MSTKALIIPAAGSGSRMQKDIPKPFLQLGGRTILECTLQRFLKLEGLRQIVVPTSEDYVDKVQRLLLTAVPNTINVQSLSGGSERQHSIAKALDKIEDADLVMVHDAVRPFVTSDQIKRCCEKAAQSGAAILGIPAKSTIKRINERGEVLETPSRNSLWEAQTPQIFHRSILKEAYRKALEDNFTGTDDASLVERLGKTVQVVKGSQQNFKITYPLDLTLAKQIINQQKA